MGVYVGDGHVGGYGGEEAAGGVEDSEGVGLRSWMEWMRSLYVNDSNCILCSSLLCFSVRAVDLVGSRYVRSLGSVYSSRRGLETVLATSQCDVYDCNAA